MILPETVTGTSLPLGGESVDGLETAVRIGLVWSTLTVWVWVVSTLWAKSVL